MASESRAGRCAIAGANRFSLGSKAVGAGRYRLRVIAQAGADRTGESVVRLRVTD